MESPIFQDVPRLPTPLGSFVHTAPLFANLSLADRATALPLVKPLLEHDLDEQTYAQYDAQSAYEMFREAGVSKELYVRFLAPMLLVTLFAPPTELSAAAALGEQRRRPDPAALHISDRVEGPLLALRSGLMMARLGLTAARLGLEVLRLGQIRLGLTVLRLALTVVIFRDCW